ncbi:MAG: serine/threonine protein kinase, partial [Polyangiaceae bacterium]|nr:serine/threonine protein kinase [Polyangiaceae bacterium]
MALQAGVRIGRFTILELLGAGGMGMVYRARDAELERDVALKVLKPELGLDAERTKRFLREAKAAGRLRHPNVISIFDVGIHEGAPFVVTELLEGETLRARLERGPVALEEALAIGRQIVAALEVAHEAGIVHRDLKPENVFLAQTGEAKLLDFGVAKILEPPMAGSAAGSASTVSLQTEPGTVIGTVGYMAPEQLRGEEVDPSADVFSFGAIFYEMVSGLRAFGGDTPVERLAAILKESPPDICDGDAREVAKVAREMVRKCLSKDPRNRYASASELGKELDRAREGSAPAEPETRDLGPPAAAPSGRPGLLAALALIIAGVPIAFAAGRCSSGPTVPEVLPAPSGSAVDASGASSAVAPIDGAPKFTRLTFRTGGIASARFAPDGMTVAYGAFFGADPLRLHVVRTDNAASRQLEIDGDVLSISK